MGHSADWASETGSWQGWATSPTLRMGAGVGRGIALFPSSGWCSNTLQATWSDSTRFGVLGSMAGVRAMLFSSSLPGNVSPGT